MYLSQRIFPWFCYFKLYTQIVWIMENVHCSPFVLGKTGFNAIHLIGKQQGYEKLLRLFCGFKYEFYKPYNIFSKFNLIEALTIPDRIGRNTVFHFSAIAKDKSFFNALLEIIGVQIKKELESASSSATKFKDKDQGRKFDLFLDDILDRVNNRGWQALQLAPRDLASDQNDEIRQFFEKRRKTIYQRVLDFVIKSQSLDQVKIPSSLVFKIINTYHYTLITQADNQSIEKSSVYIQLQRIQKTVKKLTKGEGQMTFKYFTGIENTSYQEWEEEITQQEEKESNCNLWQCLKRVFCCRFCKKRYKDMETNEAIEAKEKAYSKVLKENEYIFLIRIDPVTQNYLAKKLGIKVYDNNDMYYKDIDLDNTENYESFRDVTIQQMVMHLLEEEFDLKKYVEVGLIKSHFPCHHFSYRKHISQLWKKHFWKTLLEPLSPINVNDGILPLKQIAFYHGIQNGFYFGFLVTFTSFLIPLSLLGLGAWIYNILDPNRQLNQTLLPFTCIATSIWMSIFFEVWKRRETTLAYNFEVFEAKQDDNLCRDFSGRFEIDTIDQQVIQTNRFPTVWRRLIWEIPIFLVFTAAAVILTLLIEQIGDTIDDDFENGGMTKTMHRVFTVLNSIFEAVVMKSLDWIYDKVCNTTVGWENHKYEGEKRKSLLLKNVYYQFVTANINLFLNAYINRDYAQLHKSFYSVSLTITTLDVAQSHILPFFLYWYDLWKLTANCCCCFKSKWYKYKKEKRDRNREQWQKQQIYPTEGIEEDPSKIQNLKTDKGSIECLTLWDKSYEKMSFADFRDICKCDEKDPQNRSGIDKAREKIFSNYLNNEHEFYIEEQIQRSTIMLDTTLNVDDFYLTILTQFTYVSLYHGVLPLSSSFLCLSNLAVIFITERMYSYITKRSLSENLSNIGLWNDVFQAVGLLCIIGSAFITTYTTTSLDRYFDGSKEIALLVIIAAEHVVLGLRFLMSKIINYVPRWVRDQIRHAEKMKNHSEVGEDGIIRRSSTRSSLFGILGESFTKHREAKENSLRTADHKSSNNPLTSSFGNRENPQLMDPNKHSIQLHSVSYQPNAPSPSKMKELDFEEVKSPFEDDFSPRDPTPRGRASINQVFDPNNLNAALNSQNPFEKQYSLKKSESNLFKPSGDQDIDDDRSYDGKELSDISEKNEEDKQSLGNSAREIFTAQGGFEFPVDVKSIINSAKKDMMLSTRMLAYRRYLHKQIAFIDDSAHQLNQIELSGLKQLDQLRQEQFKIGEVKDEIDEQIKYVMSGVVDRQASAQLLARKQYTIDMKRHMNELTCLSYSIGYSLKLQNSEVEIYKSIVNSLYFVIEKVFESLAVFLESKESPLFEQIKNLEKEPQNNQKLIEEIREKILVERNLLQLDCLDFFEHVKLKIEEEIRKELTRIRLEMQVDIEGLGLTILRTTADQDLNGASTDIEQFFSQLRSVYSSEDDILRQKTLIPYSEEPQADAQRGSGFDRTSTLVPKEIFYNSAFDLGLNQNDTLPFAADDYEEADDVGNRTLIMDEGEFQALQESMEDQHNGPFNIFQQEDGSPAVQTRQTVQDLMPHLQTQTQIIKSNSFTLLVTEIQIELETLVKIQ